jgi:uncharacterized protein YcbX
MRRVAPNSDWDPRRFRPNLLLDDRATGEELGEGNLLGAKLRAPSGATLDVLLPTPRCVVPMRGREELPRDPAVLRWIASESRWDLGPFGRPACLGSYAEVAASGVVAAGDRLSVSRRRSRGAEAVVAATVARVQADLHGD